MIRLELCYEPELRELIDDLYSNKDPEKSWLNITKEDLESLFFNENRAEWLVIEYYGKIDYIERYISMVNLNLFSGYFLHVFLNNNESLAMTTDVVGKIEDKFKYMGDNIICNAEVSDEVKEGEIAFRLIAPRISLLEGIKNYHDSIKK